MKIEGFNWDSGNSEKNRNKHQASNSEAEEVFLNYPRYVYRIRKELPEDEKRFYLLGQTNAGRQLFVVYTIRENLIRVISARDMSKKERRRYEERIKKDPKIQKRG